MLTVKVWSRSLLLLSPLCKYAILQNYSDLSDVEDIIASSGGHLP